ncbi:MAG: TIGR03118 family protein [Acetobacteraceae bacterium]
MRDGQVKAISLFAKAVSAWAIITVSATAAHANAYQQINLVSNVSGLAAITDPQLINPWGMASSGAGPFWTSNQGTNSSTLYAVTGSANVAKVNINPPTGLVAIPTTAAGPQGPTGQVFNGNNASFPVGNGGNALAARFIFADLNGTISAWNGGTTSIVQATTAGAVFTGLAINSAQTRLYAANGGASGGINVFDSAFAAVSLPGAFVDPTLPAGLAPFNVQDVGGKVYVTYAPPGRASQIAATVGNGAVDVFDENGVLLQSLITGSQLAAPWGIALAPAGFGKFGGDLLVGNFSFADSVINAFDPATGAFLGSIPIDAGAASPGGLWAMKFGNGGSGGDVNTLYVTDGINGERGGLLAAVTVPEPPSLAVLLSGGLAFAAAAAWRGRTPSRERKGVPGRL